MHGKEHLLKYFTPTKTITMNALLDWQWNHNRARPMGAEKRPTFNAIQETDADFQWHDTAWRCL